MPEPVWDGTYKLIEMNMSNLDAGGADYITNTITRLRLDFGLTAVDDFQVDQIEITTGTLYAGGLYQYNASGYHNDNVNYFDGTDPVTALTTIQESSIPENESRLWVGYFYSRIGGDYVFNMLSDDGAYLWLGETATTGYTTLNRNLFTTFNTGTLSTEPITLAANTYTPIRLMIGNGVGPGYMFLSFNTPTQPQGANISTYTVTNSGASAYTINGENNPTLTFFRGFTYEFNVNASGHPFWIQTVPAPYSSGTVYNNGVTNNGTQNGTITFTVPYDAPNTLYYVCQFHSSMSGTINITDIGITDGTGYFLHNSATFGF
jgi:hypothetical protein